MAYSKAASSTYKYARCALHNDSRARRAESRQHVKQRWLGDDCDVSFSCVHCYTRESLQS